VVDRVSPHRILGIDPGTRAVGWGVVEVRGQRLVRLGHGVLRAQAARSIDLRLAAIAAGLREVLRDHSPTEAAIEEAFYGRDARAAQRLGEGRGALLLVLAEAGLTIAHYPNNVVKKAVTGAGRASKEHVRAMVTRLLALDAPPESLDATDALAIAICHNQRRGLAAEGGGIAPRLAEALRKAGVKGRPRR